MDLPGQLLRVEAVGAQALYGPATGLGLLQVVHGRTAPGPPPTAADLSASASARVSPGLARHALATPPRVPAVDVRLPDGELLPYYPTAPPHQA